MQRKDDTFSNPPPSRSISFVQILPVLFCLAAEMTAVCGFGCDARSHAPPHPAKSASGSPKHRGPEPQEPIVELTVIHTADEHGWLEPAQPPKQNRIVGGVANFFAWLTQKEGYTRDAFLLLSSGDNWTGPAISTWFAGRPMVEAFNLMGYDAIAIGNHEFDFGRSVMIERFDQSEAPYLGANILDTGTQKPAFFARPFILKEFQGVQVGIIGLANAETHTCTHPLSTLDLDFLGYAETLNTQVPRMRKAGAEIIVVLAHACRDELIEAIGALEVDVDVMFGAHCHKRFNDRVGDILLLGSGWALRSYSKLVLRYNRISARIEDAFAELVEVAYPANEPNPVDPDPALRELTARWQKRAAQMFNAPVGYTQSGLAKGSWAMANWITDTWLWAFPAADASLLVFGGMRQFIDAGPITQSEILGVLPFENTLMTVRIDGALLYEVLAHGTSQCRVKGSCYPAVGGMRYRHGDQGLEVVFFDGTPLDPKRTYTLVVTDYMYYGGSGYPFGRTPTAVDFTGINWRKPVLRWLAALRTTPNAPLEMFVDPEPRNR
jgi:2',3'-cyclic-nucleotide 2'-phosphodiesterase (5'-nucleotidase family)